jgi:predicted nucleic acid-binding protein
LILLDTSGLLAALDASQRLHAEAAATLSAAAPPRLLSPFVLAELDYLLATRVGDAARSSLLAEVDRGVYQLAPMSSADVGQASEVIKRHADLRISLADASIVVLSERHGVDEVLTLDQRHFRVLSSAGKPFRVLPADGPRVQ